MSYRNQGQPAVSVLVFSFSVDLRSQKQWISWKCTMVESQKPMFRQPSKSNGNAFRLTNFRMVLFLLVKWSTELNSSVFWKNLKEKHQKSDFHKDGNNFKSQDWKQISIFLKRTGHDKFKTTAIYLPLTTKSSLSWDTWMRLCTLSCRMMSSSLLSSKYEHASVYRKKNHLKFIIWKIKDIGMNRVTLSTLLS